MDKGIIFEKLLHLAVEKGITVKFMPLLCSESRIKGDRLALRQDLNIEKINYNLALELSHAFLHYDKGDITVPGKQEQYEKQADRAARMLLNLLEGG